MSQIQSLEQRLTALEKEVADLKRQLPSNGNFNNWIENITGSFEDDPDFAEILRLGQEIRRADRPRDEDQE